jgi:hypothetical protein
MIHPSFCDITHSSNSNNILLYTYKYIHTCTHTHARTHARTHTVVKNDSETTVNYWVWTSEKSSGCRNLNVPQCCGLHTFTTSFLVKFFQSSHLSMIFCDPIFSVCLIPCIALKHIYCALRRMSQWYLRDPSFKSHCRVSLKCVKFWFSSDPGDKIGDSTLTYIKTASFHICSNYLLSYPHNKWQFTVWTTDTAVAWPINIYT